MDLKNVLRSFKQSRLLLKQKLNYEQRRTAFKYWKFEPQEKMDGYSKAKEHWRKIPRKSFLAPKYRLRPFSPRFVPTELFDFMKVTNGMQTISIGILVIGLFLAPFYDRYMNEKILIEHYHPETDTETVFILRENLLGWTLNCDNEEGVPYQD